MCFSAEASFASAAVLIPMGGYCLWSAARRLPKHWPFATVPFVFGIQQAAEGLVWLGLDEGRSDQVRVATAVYLFFALAWWPFWFPVAATVLAKGRTRRWLAAGAVLSTGWFFLAYLPAWTDGGAGLRADLAHHSIRYPHGDEVVFGGANRWVLTGLYCTCTGIPLLILGPRAIVVPVVAAFGSVSLSAIAFGHAYVSVWCFFAALLSAYCVYFFATTRPAESPNDAPRPS